MSLRAVDEAPATSAAAEAPRAAAARRPLSASCCGSRLSAMGSVMLLAVTNHVTQNIASVPFLWVVPLSLYLVTFILCFDHPRWYKPLTVRRRCWSPRLPAMAWQIPSLDL